MKKKKKKEIDKIQLITCIVIVISVLAIVYFVISYQSRSQNYTNEYNENKKVLAQLQNTYESGSQEETDTEESASNKLNSAVTLGNEVAKLQNSYYDIYADNYINVSEVDEEAYGSALKLNSEKLAKCFDKEDVSGCAIWYLNENTDATWSFRTTFSFLGKEVPTLWTCYNTSGEMLAFVTATYNAENDNFTDVNCNITSVGHSYDGNDSEEPEKTQKPKATKKPKPKKEPIITPNISSNTSTSSNNNGDSSTKSNPSPTKKTESSKKSIEEEPEEEISSSDDGDWNTDEQATEWEG